MSPENQSKAFQAYLLKSYVLLTVLISCLDNHLTIGAQIENAVSSDSMKATECARVKFSAIRVDTTSFSRRLQLAGMTSELQQLGAALREMEDCGAAPILPDGKIAGNAAILFSTAMGEHEGSQNEGRQDGEEEEAVIVTRSGKCSQAPLALEDLVCVTDFSRDRWTCKYEAPCGSSKSEAGGEVLPTSDTPLCWLALKGGRYLQHHQLERPPGWTDMPRVALHGHALEDGVLARQAGIPVSVTATECSTPEDYDAMVDLFSRYSYPEHKVFVRLGHGFFILGSSVEETLALFREQIVPLLS